MLDRDLSLYLSDCGPSAALEHDGKRYTLCAAADDQPIFYDWLDDTEGTLCGVEIHLEPGHPLVGALRVKSYVTFDPYPQVKFRQAGPCVQRGVEAFGGIELLRASEQEWLIALELSTWLTPDDIATIRILASNGMRAVGR